MPRLQDGFLLAPCSTWPLLPALQWAWSLLLLEPGRPRRASAASITAPGFLPRV